MGTKPVRISYRSPWQNGTAERWIGNCRREMLEHVVVLSERHLVRLMRLYISYYHEDRCYLSLDKDTPNSRPRLVKKFVRHFDRVARPEYGLTRPCCTNYSGSTRLRVIADQYRNRPTRYCQIELVTDRMVQ